MTKHHKPLYINACINGKTISRVIVDGGAVLNVMPVTTMMKLGRKKEESVPTTMKMSNFTGETIAALGVLVADVTFGTKTLSSDFFVVEAKPTYAMLLERDWIHSSQCVPSTLHQILMFWEANKVETVEADKNPFSADVKMVEAIFYSPHLELVQVSDRYKEGSWSACNVTTKGFEIVH